MKHLTEEQLFALVDGGVAPNQGEALRDHLGGCSECRTSLEEVRKLVTDLAPEGASDEDAHVQRVMQRVAARPDAKRTEMPSKRPSVIAAAFRRTRVHLALAVLAIVPLAFLTFRDFAADVAPVCTTGTIEEFADWEGRWTNLSKPDLEKRPEQRFDEEKDGGLFHLDTKQTPWEGGRDRVTWARIRRIGRDTRGERCECGSVVLRDACVSALGGTLRRHDDGTYLYVDAVHGPCDAFRVVNVPTRRFQRDRIFERRHLPALIALGAIGALVIAALRVRRGVSYATKVSDWTEATVHPGGRVESQTGDLLGISELHRPGTVLVEPRATQGQGLYRDVQLLPRRSVLVGSHAQWQRMTARRFRDARVLAIVSVACTTLGVIARQLAM